MSLLRAQVTELTKLMRRNLSNEAYQPETVELDGPEETGTSEEVEEIETKPTEERREKRAPSFADVDELRALKLVVERLGAVSLLRDVARGW